MKPIRLLTCLLLALASFTAAGTRAADPVSVRLQELWRTGDEDEILGIEYHGGSLVIYRFLRTFTDEYADQDIFLQQVLPDGHPGVEYHHTNDRDVPNKMVLDETERGEVLQRSGVGPDGRVWLADGYTDYVLRVWNPNGSVDRVE